MKILITGTAGFIGFHLAGKLAKKDHDIIGIDNINDYYDVSLKLDRLKEAGFENMEKLNEDSFSSSKKYSAYRFKKIHLEDKEGLMELFSSFNPEIVIHLAAQAGVRYSLTHPEAYIHANITGFLNILECCRAYPVRHLLYASSSSVYGLNKKMPFSVKMNVDHPVSLYAASKKSNELMAHTYSHLFGIPSTGLRFFTVYGPWGRPDMALFLFTRAILSGEPIHVFNHGRMERDFTYVDDIVDGIEKIMNNPPAGNNGWIPEIPDPSSSSAPYRIYNIGNNSPVKLMDFITAIEEKTGKKAVVKFEGLQPGDVEKTWADVAELMEHYSYKPSTSISDGINQFVNWYRWYYNC
ncbi:MAG: NAD-dependent epimerase [Bacteroidales bacterium]|nr:NAD-dependent epimerase [Bacteroidales bacterium]